jgi:hypothetical protein
MENKSLSKENYFNSKTLNIIIKVFSVLAAIVGILLTLFYINTPQSSLQIKILTNTSLVDVKEDFPKLNIVYDTIDFINDKKNISITILEIINTGNKSISTNDYDLSIPFGFKLINADLIKHPELISSSDIEYFKDIVVNKVDNDIHLDYKIIDPKEYFQLKLYSIHDIEEKPLFESLGKISGQKKISITDSSDDKEQSIEKALEMNKITTNLSILLIIILSLLNLSLYKNNNLRAKANSLLIEKNEKLMNKLLDEEKKE